MNDQQHPQGQPEGGPADDEQAASLQALLSGAEEPEQQAAKAAQQAEQAEANALMAQVQENAQMVEFAWDVVGGMLPEKIAVRYGPDQRMRIAQSGTMLAAKRGWDMGAFMAKWGAEIAFAAALVGPSVPVIIDAIKNRKKAEEKALTGPPPAESFLGPRPDDTPVPDTGVKSPTTAEFGAVIPS